MAVVFSWEKAATVLNGTHVFISPTDTVFGLQAAFSPENEARLQTLKGSHEHKLITLVSSFEMARSITIISKQNERLLAQYWPGPITFILPSPKGKMALRWPKHSELCSLIEKIGKPLYSTSCNLHGSPTCQTLEEAQRIFGDNVDFYIEGASQKQTASTLVDLSSDTPVVLRAGAILFPT